MDIYFRISQNFLKNSEHLGVFLQTLNYLKFLDKSKIFCNVWKAFRTLFL